MASGQALEAGSTYDVSDKDAEILIRMGKAEEAKEEAKPKPKRKPKANGAS